MTRTNLPADFNPGALRHSNMILLGALAATAATITLAAPSAITLAEGETERDAILLECCDLPDKGLTLTEQDLDDIAGRFTQRQAAGDGDVPIKLQHVDSPLDPFGAVKRVWRVGSQLFGKIAFPPAIAQLVRDRGALAVSCGLDRAPLRLSEVSLVIKGRLPAATLLSEDESAELVRLRSESEALRAENTQQRVDAQIVQLKLAGKIIPATEKAARVLLSAPASALITLADGTAQEAAGAFLAFLSASPALVTLGEHPALVLAGGVVGAAASTEGGATGEEDVTLTDDERDFYAKALDVNPDHVVETMKANKRKAKTHGAAGAGHHGTSPMGSHPQEGHRV